MNVNILVGLAIVLVACLMIRVIAWCFTGKSGQAKCALGHCRTYAAMEARLKDE